MLETFGARVVFVGIQGSVGRDKATPDSDRDVVVLLDAFTYENLPFYGSLEGADGEVLRLL